MTCTIPYICLSTRKCTVHSPHWTCGTDPRKHASLLGQRCGRRLWHWQKRPKALLASSAAGWRKKEDPLVIRAHLGNASQLVIDKVDYQMFWWRKAKSPPVWLVCIGNLQKLYSPAWCARRFCQEKLRCARNMLSILGTHGVDVLLMRLTIHSRI